MQFPFVNEASHLSYRVASIVDAKIFYSSEPFPFKDKMRTGDRGGRIRE